MDYWAPPTLDRNQIRLFSPTLDATIGQSHPVRLFDEILAEMDWTAWEAEYNGTRGQPPIHPRIMAAVILYGLSRGKRSSRELEADCINSLDFIWLTSGRRLDHSTICKFRVRFARPLKDIFGQIGRLAMSMGMVRLNDMGLDGTRVLANSSRHGTRSAKTLQEKLAVLDQQIEEAFREAGEADLHDQTLFGSDSPNTLPAKLGDLRRRQEALRKALASAQAADARRRDRSDAPDCPAKAPVADPDSAVMPNKEGGHAPNYTPMAAVDGQAGLIVDADVTAEATESQMTVETVDRIEQTFGRRPQRLLADGHHGTGQNLADLAERGIEAYIPTDQGSHDNPARRPDPAQPVDQSLWPLLPRKGKKDPKLDKSAFVYDAALDVYYCPMGRTLAYARSEFEARREGGVHLRIYRCGDCSGCPLARDCLSQSQARTVRRDEHEPLREQAAALMRTAEGQQVYRRRKWICETPFAVIKSRQRFRRFLLRGLQKVRTEWLWACAAFNLAKLALRTAGLRVALAAAAA